MSTSWDGRPGIGPASTVDAPQAAGSKADWPEGTGEAAGEPAVQENNQAPPKGRKRRRRRRRKPVFVRPESADNGPAEAASRGPAAFYGALDLGTNNCRLLVAVPKTRGFHVVDAFSRIVRLGEGIATTGRLGDDAMARAIDALKVCSSKLAYRDVSRVRLIATEACRAAENGPAFIERVASETGLELDIVTQEAEARLAVTGCSPLIDPEASGVILFDIGGGSSELVWIDMGETPLGEGEKPRAADRIRSWMSLPVGVVNISERHGGRHVTPEKFEAMVAEVAALLESFPEVEQLDRAFANGAIHMLGTSGTVTTLAGVHLGLPRYDRRRVDGIWLGGDRVAELVSEFAAMDYDARLANPCIGRERADLVLAGCAILEAFRRRWPVDRLRVADRGLREGALVEMMTEDGAWQAAKSQPKQHG